MVRLKGFEKLTGVDEALSTFVKKLKLERLESIQIPVQEALRRVAAEDFVAKTDLPPFNRSAVDGYAIRAENTFEASQFSPKVLKVTQGDRIGKNETRPVWTGNPIPKGADAVVMLEHTKSVQDKIEVWTPLTPGENVSKRGEDVRKGEVAVEAGTRLQPHHLGLLAALGATRVSVVEKPRVAVLSTGDELVEPGRKSRPNQMVDVNRLILSCMCLELGAEPLDLGIARDDVNEIGARVKEGVKRADVTITTGGTSVGYADLVPAAVNQIGTPGVVVHGIAMRPGMPTALAILHGKPVLILSGNPVAAMIGFEVFARPVLLRLLGVKSEPRPVVKARITRRVAAALGRRVFLRVHTFERDGEFFADPVRV
ncbi:molybdopterin molybdotransferase MoeA, partial [Candidatus Bathyarchaeota archaeon]|nr:molybdopterin molybdotransferase MoeA [Candidatus Bathyarchaeota archaeon]